MPQFKHLVLMRLSADAARGDRPKSSNADELQDKLPGIVDI